MKNTIFAALGALFISASANAQSTADSIAAKYQQLPMPERLTIEKTFPVLGTYEMAGEAEEAATLTVSLDPDNKGIVWVEGLPQGKLKAYLRKSPATYRIISQKTEAGRQVPEGTLHLDQQTNTLHISLGAPYNVADPASVFALNNANAAEAEVKTKKSTSKTKAKVRYYTATKVEQNTTASALLQQ